MTNSESSVVNFRAGPFKAFDGSLDVSGSLKPLIPRDNWKGPTRSSLMAVVNHAYYNFLVTRPGRMFALTMGHNNVLDVFDASTFPMYSSNTFKNAGYSRAHYRCRLPHN